MLACHLIAEGWYQLGDERLQPRAPYLVALPAGEIDGNELTSRMDAHWCLFVGGGLATGRQGRVRLALGTQTIERGHVRHLDPAEAHAAVDLFREMASLQRRVDLTARIGVAARLLDLLALWARPSAEEGGMAVEAYRALIERHACEESVPLTALAARIGFDSDHLGVGFREQQGMSPMEYRLLRVRLIRYAREAIADGQSLASAAQPGRLRGSGRYFARQFRRCRGGDPVSALAREARRNQDPRALCARLPGLACGAEARIDWKSPRADGVHGMAELDLPRGQCQQSPARRRACWLLPLNRAICTATQERTRRK